MRRTPPHPLLITTLCNLDISLISAFVHAGQGGDGHTGMLVVDSVLPGGPADGKLQPGDVLVRLGGRVTTAFLPLEAALDAAVGTSVQLDIERAGVPQKVEVAVQVCVVERCACPTGASVLWRAVPDRPVTARHAC